MTIYGNKEDICIALVSEQVKFCTHSFLQLPLIEAPSKVLDFCVMKPGMVLTFLELLIK